MVLLPNTNGHNVNIAINGWNDYNVRVCFKFSLRRKDKKKKNKNSRWCGNRTIQIRLDELREKRWNRSLRLAVLRLNW